MLRRAGYEIACRPSVRLSVRPSVRDDQVPSSHRLKFFENNFTAKQLKAHELADPNVGFLVQREHPQN